MSKNDVLNVIRYFAAGGKGFYAQLLSRIYEDPAYGDGLLQSIVDKDPADFVDVMFAANSIAA